MNKSNQKKNTPKIVVKINGEIKTPEQTVMKISREFS